MIFFYKDYTDKSLKRATGKEIAGIGFSELALVLCFGEDKLKIWDDGQQCCEERYLHTDDDLEYYVGARFLGFEVVSVPNVASKDCVHEMAFLKVSTSKGVFTIETHNEHNGFYGGFWVKAEYIEGDGMKG